MDEPAFKNHVGDKVIAKGIASLTISQYSKGLKEGQDNSIYGTLRYLGPVVGKEGIWAGIELDLYDPSGKPQIGKNDGSVEGHRYFQCAPGRGIFVSSTRIQPYGSNDFKGQITAGGFSLSPDKPFSKNINTPIKENYNNSNSIKKENRKDFNLEKLNDNSEVSAVTKAVISKYRSELDKLKEQSNIQIESNTKLINENSNLKESLQKSQEECDRIREEMRLRISAASRRLSLEHSTPTIIKTQQNINHENNELLRHKEEAYNLRVELEKAKEMIAYLHSKTKNDESQKISILQSKLTDVERAKESAEVFLQSRIDSLQNRLDYWIQRENSLIGKESDLEKREKEMLSTQEETFENLNHKILKMQEQLNEKDIEVQSLKRERKREEAEYALLKAQLSACRAELIEMERQGEWAEKELERFAALLHEQRETIMHLNEEKKELLSSETKNDPSLTESLKFDAIEDASRLKLLEARLRRQMAVVEREKRMLEDELSRLKSFTQTAKEIIEQAKKSFYFNNLSDRLTSSINISETTAENIKNLKKNLDEIDTHLGHIPWNIWFTNAVHKFRSRFSRSNQLKNY